MDSALSWPWLAIKLPPSGPRWEPSKFTRRGVGKRERRELSLNTNLLWGFKLYGEATRAGWWFAAPTASVNHTQFHLHKDCFRLRIHHPCAASMQFLLLIRFQTANIHFITDASVPILLEEKPLMEKYKSWHEVVVFQIKVSTLGWEIQTKVQIRALFKCLVVF